MTSSATFHHQPKHCELRGNLSTHTQQAVFPEIRTFLIIFEAVGDSIRSVTQFFTTAQRKYRRTTMDTRLATGAHGSDLSYSLGCYASWWYSKELYWKEVEIKRFIWTAVKITDLKYLYPSPITINAAWTRNKHFRLKLILTFLFISIIVYTLFRSCCFFPESVMLSKLNLCDEKYCTR